MPNTVQIYCKNTKQFHDVPRGSSLLEIYQMLNITLPYRVVAAHVNYKVENLNYYLYGPKDVEFIDASVSDGMCVYVRTLCMTLCCAVNELYPGATLRIEHPISLGYYCTLKLPDGTGMKKEMVGEIKQRMKEIIEQDRTIVCHEKRTKDVMQLFRNHSDGESNLFETFGDPYSKYYSIGDYIDYYNGVLMPSTGYLSLFDLVEYHDGILLRIPNRKQPTILEQMPPQEKMFSTFEEFVKWNRLMHISNVSDFNIACQNQKTVDMIKLSEALHEKKIAGIADTIAERKPKFVLISGPSSSGKTTFSKRLNIQLRVNGLTPVVISMDNYFVNRELTPKDENGDYDFEDIHALDLDLFGQHLKALLNGEEVDMPTYRFEDGKRYYEGDKLKIEPDNIVIVEGIHALNPILMPDIPQEYIFRIYVSALTTVNLDNHNWIPTTDIRLLRRIVRDYRYRNYSAKETIARCPSVRRGEEKWIYPYQENADVMFNSALIFELAVLKRHAEPILSEVPKYCDEYTEAHRLLKFLRFFVSVPEKEIPPTSLLREFVGGSSFHY